MYMCRSNCIVVVVYLECCNVTEFFLGQNAAPLFPLFSNRGSVLLGMDGCKVVPFALFLLAYFCCCCRERLTKLSLASALCFGLTRERFFGKKKKS